MDMVPLVDLNTTTVTATNVTISEATYNAGTTYASAAVVKELVDGLYRRFTSLQNSNTGHTPSTSPTWWQDDGPVNAHAMFDDTISTRTSNADEITCTIEVPATERIDCFYFAGLDAVSVRLTVTDPLAGLAYDETHSLADVSAILDWHGYFFLEVVYLEELLLVDLPTGAGSELGVTITKTGSTAYCGAVATGFRRSLGGTRWGFRTEIRDYSRVLEDEITGAREFIEGNFRRLASGEAIVDNRVKDAIERALTGARADVRLYIADEDYRTLTMLGVARWAMEMSLPPSRSLLSLQIESVV